MDDNDWIFAKLPNWLRWVLALPVGILASAILPILAKFSNYMIYGGEANGILIQVFIMLASIAGFLFGLFYCVPKFKVIITSVISILLAIYFSIFFILDGLQGYWWITENLVNLISAIVCIYLGVYLLLHKDEVEVDSEDDTINL